MELFYGNSQELDAFNCFRKKLHHIYVWESSNYALLAVSFLCNVNKVTWRYSFLKNFANFSGEHLRWETHALQAFRPATCNFIKNRLQQKCFPVKFLRAPFSIEQLLWLLFKISSSNNLLKDVSAISRTLNQSLITCSSQNGKLI